MGCPALSNLAAIRNAVKGIVSCAGVHLMDIK
jgi:hypothetical protein